MYDFSSNVLDIDVVIYWGVRDIATDGIDQWNPEELGTVILDERFDLSSVEAQTAVLEFCRDLKN